MAKYDQSNNYAVSIIALQDGKNVDKTKTVNNLPLQKLWPNCNQSSISDLHIPVVVADPE